MIQYLIVGALGLISLTTMCLFLLVKEGTKGKYLRFILKRDDSKYEFVYRMKSDSTAITYDANGKISELISGIDD